MRHLLTMLVLLAVAAWGQPGSTEFQAGNALMEQKKFAEALERYQAGLQLAPDNQGLLYNGGLAAYLVGDGAQAVKLWQKLKAAAPNDWRLRAKLVQAYQLSGEPESRDREVQELLALHDTSHDEEFARQKEFCRDQFRVGDQQVMAYQLFALEGDRAVRYLFLVYDLGTGKRADFHLSLGSYAATNQMLRETGTIGPEQRVFHLDWYGPKEHRTYGLYLREPSYDEARQAVTGALDGTLKPQSSSRQG